MDIDLGFGLIIAGVIILAVMLVAVIMFALSRYQTCSSNEILVKYGQVGKDKTSIQMHGGGTFVWPVIQQYARLSLDPINSDIDLNGALSKQNIRVNVPSSFTYAIGTTSELMSAAAERLLHKSSNEIRGVASEIIFGQLRATIATMDIEEINSDREKFERLVVDNIDGELRKVGLALINTNIQDITDESGYIEALGKEAAARAVNEAVVKVAAHDRDGAQGAAEAKAEERKAVADANAKAVQGENTAAIIEADSVAERKVREAEARRLSDAAEAVKRAEADKEGYAAEKAAEETRAERDKATQFANEVVPAQIAAEKLVVEAKADEDAAKHEAEAIRAKERAPLQGKAEGFRDIVEAAGGDPKAAAMLLIVEQLPNIVRAQAEAIQNIDFGEITVIGGGQSGAEGAANFLRSTTSMLPELHAIAEAAGLKLPDFLGAVQDSRNLKAPTKESADESSATDSSTEVEEM